MTLSPTDLKRLAAHKKSTGSAEGFVPVAPRRPRKNEEFQLQAALVAWWAVECHKFGVPEFLLWHTPNSAVYGGSKAQREKMGAMLKRLGQRSGVPDLFLAVPRVKAIWHVNEKAEFIGHSGLFLELKTPTGRLSPEQEIYHGHLRGAGYRVEVCRTLEDAQKVITEYLT